MLPSHVKRSLLLSWLHIKIAPYDAFPEMHDLVFHWIINRILHGRMEIGSKQSVKYFSTL